MLFLTSIAVMSAAPAAPTLAQVEAVSPRRAGELLLGGRMLRPVVSVRRAPSASINPPGWIEVELFEAPRAATGGCVRQYWQAVFRKNVNNPDETAVFQRADPRVQVALADRGCGSPAYADVQAGVSTDRALHLLRTMRRIAVGAAATSFDCKDETSRALCGTPRTIRAELRKLSPWQVKESNGIAELWLGTPGQIVTAVTFDADRPRAVSVTRRIPAPF
jgi:hypothetical protein